MSSALKAIEVGRKDVLALCAEIPDAVWADESGCPGWSVQDLVSHMACSFWLVEALTRAGRTDTLLLPTTEGLRT